MTNVHITCVRCRVGPIFVLRSDQRHLFIYDVSGSDCIQDVHVKANGCFR